MVRLQANVTAVAAALLATLHANERDLAFQCVEADTASLYTHAANPLALQKVFRTAFRDLVRLGSAIDLVG